MPGAKLTLAIGMVNAVTFAANVPLAALLELPVLSFTVPAGTVTV